MKEKDRFREKTINESSDVSSILKQLDYKGNLKFRFSALLHRTITEQRDYGNGEQIKMLDAHILKDIDENPGMLSVELARNWCRTRSAICVIVQRLEESGYITKEFIDGNKKERALFATEKGRQLCELHRRYDAMQTSALINEMLGYCTAEEIDAYFKVLDYQIKVMQKGYFVDEDGNPGFDYTGEKTGGTKS